MMSSSYPNPYQRIYHRSVFNSLQEVSDKKCGECNISDNIFRPITESNNEEEELQSNNIIGHKNSVHNTKIPIRKSYPLTTIWTNTKNHRRNKKRSKSYDETEPCHSTESIQSKLYGVGVGGQLRLRISKSEFPLIVKPLAYETADTLKCTTHESETAGGRVCRKQTRVDSSKQNLSDPLQVRSHSLRKNYKYSVKTDSSNKHQNYQPKQQDPVSACPATKPEPTTTTTETTAINVSHDNVAAQKIKRKAVNQNDTMSTNKDQGDGPLPRDSSRTEQDQKQQQQKHEHLSEITDDSDASLINELRDLSLKQSGVQSSSATTPTQQKQQNHQHQQQHHTPHSRPATLATPASNNSTGEDGGGLKTPRSPKTTTAIPAPEASTPQQHQRQHHHHNHLHRRHHRHHQEQQQQQEEGNISPDCKATPKTPPVTPDSPTTHLDDDLASVYSYATTSGRSTMSCEHPFVARNGTTFSGRKMKYVVHCSNYAGQIGSDYLTPTQRAQRQIKRLKELLCNARQDLEQKDSEILRLTHEVVDLRLFKASLSSPDERSASSDAVTVREAELKTSQDVSPIVDMVDDVPQKSHHHHHHHHQHKHHGHHDHHGDGGGSESIHAASESPTAMLHHHQQHLSQNSHHHHQHHVMHDMQSSFADSGHFEDMTSSSVHSKSSSSCGHSMTHGHGLDQACGGVVVGEGDVHHNDEEASASTIAQYELQRQELIRMYEQRIEDLVRSQDSVTSDIKRSNNDRIEALLQKLAECNTRYADIVPDYEHAKERIRELEKQLEDLQRKLSEHEEKQKQMYLHMYQKGQEAERIARADQALELAHRAPQNSKVSINELLHQLQSTQDELENIRAAECRKECGSNHALLTAKEAISLWVLGARKTIYRRLLEAQKNRTHVDPEVTLQFLKSAVYYFLTDKENSQGHLQAIESILEFSEAEKQTINKARNSK